MAHSVSEIGDRVPNAAPSVSHRVRRYLVDAFLFGENDVTLGNDDSLIEKGIIDSTAVLQIVAYLDDHFGVSVSDTELVAENFDTINRLSAFIERKLAA